MALATESISENLLQQLYFFFAAVIKALKIEILTKQSLTGQIIGVKTMPKSLLYHPFLIKQLKDPSFASLYLETHFELEEGEEPAPQLIRLALSHVLEALGEQKMTTEEAKMHLEKLDEILSQQGSDVIYNLGNWLKALGLKLTVTVCEPEEIVKTAESQPELSVSQIC
jgi:DNA-binding phage protein